MIAIDYVPGSHGHFLSFVCNRFLTDIPLDTIGESPLTATGTSHNINDIYWNSRHFREAHYYLNQGHWQLPPQQCPSLREWYGKVIQIWFEPQDLLTLTATCFLRAGDLGIDLDQLHNDTYHKLDVVYYRMVRDELQQMSLDNLQQSVRSVSDPSWPLISTWQDWDRLPADIRNECEYQHGIRAWRFDHDHVDCPRSVLREYFRNSFRKDASNGFMRARDSMIYNAECDVYRWQFRDFFDTQRFVTAMGDLAQYFGLHVRDLDRAADLHDEFLHGHRYRHSLPLCQQIMTSWSAGANHDLQGLTLLEQAWIECQIEEITGCDLHQDRVDFWNDLDEIRRFMA